MDWITGSRFMQIADFTYSPQIKHQDDYYKLPNTFNKHSLKDRNIVFTTPFYVNQLFYAIRPLTQEFIIITHNGDNRIDPDGIVFLNGAGGVLNVEPYFIPDNVITWYAQNVNTVDSRIESIPIGLENDNKFHKEVHKKDQMIDKLKDYKRYKNLVYMNHTIRTNPQERIIPYDLLESMPFVDSERETNGYKFDSYIDNIYNHKFVICPEGNGMDTHRTWETLYMRSIPIEKRNLNNRFYTDLPICFVDKWEDITEKFLRSEYWRIKLADWNMDKLTMQYWINKIRE